MVKIIINQIYLIKMAIGLEINIGLKDDGLDENSNTVLQFNAIPTGLGLLPFATYVILLYFIFKNDCILPV